MSTPSPETTASMDSTLAADTPRCQPPANVRREVRRYEESATVDVWAGPRYRMRYWLHGQGPPLIWAPGIAATHRVYAMVLNRLAERFQTIQYCYPGDEPGDGARLGRIGHEHLVEDLLGLIDHLGIRQAYLAGISFGSTIALRALRKEPDRFSKTVVQGAFAHREFTIAERMALFLGRRIPGQAARLPLRERILAYNSRLDFPSLIKDRWPFYLEQNGLTPIRALAHRTSLVAGLDLRPILSTLTGSLLLVQGREDRIVPYRYFEELTSALPHAESVVMPTVGHIPHLSHPEFLARVIGDWLLPCQPPACTGAGPAEGCPGSAGGCLADAETMARCEAARASTRSED